MSAYYPILLGEMNNFITYYSNDTHYEVDVEDVYEVVYQWPIGPNLYVRVYTSITSDGEEVRDPGADAIRPQVVARNTSGRTVICQSARRVHRVEGWRNNLTKRLDALMVAPIPTCPQCKAYMKLRRNQRDWKEFYGCIEYPICTYTVSLDIFARSWLRNDPGSASAFLASARNNPR